MTHHGAGLRRLGQSEELIAQLKEDYRKAPLSEQDLAMLEYVDLITRNPAGATQDMVRHLKTHGFSESAILDIVQIAGYYAFVNRLADGLGVELEDEQQE